MDSSMDFDLDFDAPRNRTRRAKKILLESLGRIVAIPEESVGFYKQNCMVCFHHNDHRSGVKLKVDYQNSNTEFVLVWQGDITERILRAFSADMKRATDNAACAIALLLVEELTEFTAIEQAAIGTTIDYYLATKNQDEILIFNHAARLEVSGILAENEGNTVDARIRDKLRRLKQDENLPAFILVAEFSQPWSKMVEA
jgi:hypothetical protein